MDEGKNDHLITTVFDLGFSEFLGIENKCRDKVLDLQKTLIRMQS